MLTAIFEARGVYFVAIFDGVVTAVGVVVVVGDVVVVIVVAVDDVVVVVVDDVGDAIFEAHGVYFVNSNLVVGDVVVGDVVVVVVVLVVVVVVVNSKFGCCCW